jgi:integral membrane sensor domain MASE1
MDKKRGNLATILILALVYFAAVKLGLKFALVNPSATALWIPTGISLTAFLILGYRVWPAIFLGAFLANLTTAGSWLTSITISIGNTCLWRIVISPSRMGCNIVTSLSRMVKKLERLEMA